MMSIPLANEAVYDDVRDVNGSKDSWTIMVKIVSVWKQTYKNNPREVATMDMILIDREGTKIRATIKDREGTKIHATIKKNLLRDFESLFDDGSVREISNFQVGSNTGNYMFVKHPCKINFMKSTKVRVLDDFVPFESVQIYDFPAIVDLHQKNIDMRVAFDIVGQVVDNNGMYVKFENGKQTRVMNFNIQDLSGEKIPCALWDDYALKLHTYISENQDVAPVIVLMLNARLKLWLEKPQVTNHWFGTKLYINDDIQPISDFKESLVDNDISDSSSSRLTPLSSNVVVKKEEDYYLEFNIRNIDDIPDIKTETGLSIIATIISFQTDEGWYYFACRVCGRKVKRSDGSEPYECDECGGVSDVYRKVRVVVRVQDATGTSSFVLFERHITSLICRGAPFLLEKITKDEGRQIFPEEFNKILNRKFLFKIQVSFFNLNRNYLAYTVHKLTDDERVMDVIYKQSPTYKEQYALGDGTPDNLANKKKENVSVMDDNIQFVDLEAGTPSPNLGKRSYDIVDNNTSIGSSSSKALEGVDTLKIPKMQRLE